MKAPLCLAALLITAISGFASDTPGKTLHEALYTAKPVVVDGKLDDPVWQKATVYPMNVAWGKAHPELPLSEGGKVQLAWDDQYLYLAARLDDVDIVAEGDADQGHHYRTGDLMELFLRPPGQRWYWELYGTPHSRKTAFFFPSRGRLFLPSSEKDPMNLKVAAIIDGTLNEWKDQDKGWTLEMAIPLKDLTALGDRVEEGAPAWRILIARYNYSAYHEVRGGEFSTTSPSFRDADFHNFDVWGELRFVKAKEEKTQ